jgi:hypothetical protein
VVSVPSYPHKILPTSANVHLTLVFIKHAQEALNKLKLEQKVTAKALAAAERSVQQLERKAEATERAAQQKEQEIQALKEKLQKTELDRANEREQVGGLEADALQGLGCLHGFLARLDGYPKRLARRNIMVHSQGGSRWQIAPVITPIPCDYGSLKGVKLAPHWHPID